MMKLETLLAKERDIDLISIQDELTSGVIPSSGKAHGYCRKVNKLIDSGNLCINTTTFRRVYLPTLAKAVQRELAKRYVAVLRGTRQPQEILDISKLEGGE